MTLIGRAEVTWLTLALLLVQTGCATASHPVPSPLPPEMRAQLRKVGVVSGRFVPATLVERPAAGKVRGAAQGAAVYALSGAAAVAAEFGRGCSGNSCGFAAVIALGVLIGAVTIGAITGAVIGAVVTESAVKAREAEAALQHAFAELKIQQALRDRLVTLARDEARLDLGPIGDVGPTGPEEDTDYRPLAAEGIDTVLEVSATRLGLVADEGGGPNPQLALTMTTRVRLVRTSDGAELYREALSRRSGSRKFVEWAAHDAQAFREGLDAAYTSVAREIIGLVLPHAQGPPLRPAPTPAAPEPSLSAVPINVWKTAPIGAQGAIVRYRLIERGSPLDTCAPPLVSVRTYEGGITCAPAELVK